MRQQGVICVRAAMARLPQRKATRMAWRTRSCPRSSTPPIGWWRRRACRRRHSGRVGWSLRQKSRSAACRLSRVGSLRSAAGLQQQLRLFSRNGARGHGAAFRDDLVGHRSMCARCAGSRDLLIARSMVRFVFAQMKGDGARAQLAIEEGRKQMLAGVLLHVVQAAPPVDGPFDLRCRRAMAWSSDARLHRSRPLPPRWIGTSSVFPLGAVAASVPVSCGWPPLVG